MVTEIGTVVAWGWRGGNDWEWAERTFCNARTFYLLCVLSHTILPMVNYSMVVMDSSLYVLSSQVKLCCYELSKFC